MSLLCTCPTGASIPNIPLGSCPESLGQIQKVIFQRIHSSGATKNSFKVSEANPNLKASWTSLLSSQTGTKVVQSPYIEGPTTEVGDAITFGGGNETLGGIELILGREPTTFSGNFYRIEQKTVRALKKLMCEKIGVYLIDEFGRIHGLADNPDTPAYVFPIPINGLFISDKKLGGFDEPDVNLITWKFFPNWSDNLTTVTPTDFDALTDLVTPS